MITFDKIVNYRDMSRLIKSSELTPIWCYSCPKRHSTKFSRKDLTRRVRIVSSSLSKNKKEKKKKEEEEDEIKKNPLWNFISKNTESSLTSSVAYANAF